MIVYQETKEKFLDDVLGGNIADNIATLLHLNAGKKVSHSEKESFRSTMVFMFPVLSDKEIPNDCGITIEYNIPQTSKRVDFIITGQDQENRDNAIFIELKQWSSAEMTEKDGVVKTHFQYGIAEVSHPSYQAWSYTSLLQSFNETVYQENILLQPCAYLHNYLQDNVIDNDFYSEYLQKAPAFFRGDAKKLQAFIKRFVKQGDKNKIMYRIENGKIRPSKSLADSLGKLLKGNKEFIMIDDQKVVYETALNLARQSSENNKNVLIIEGGPGTGKTVVAVNLLVELTKKYNLLAKYVTKNAAPRAVYESKLTGQMKRTEFSHFFTGSGAFIDVENNFFDALIVDEAHRLNEKSGMFKHLGENQIKEIIQASKFSVFFIDEDQKVTMSDIGEIGEIKMWAGFERANVHTLQLSSQFRCNGSDGYLAWLDNALQIHETANTDLKDIEYDFQVIDDPNILRDIIFEKNKLANKARLVAGYCWNWVSKKNPEVADIQIPEKNFGMKWNLASDGNLWIMASKSVNEVGCIHTCQGLEMDYVGVIVGPDLTVRNGKIVTDPFKRAKTDKSLQGFKTQYKKDPESAMKTADRIIKNTYRTLMTRGMKGCYVYFVDDEAREWFKNKSVKTSI